ncbi:MAG TPA: CPBP family intramembrane glutamic endopeptidase [Nitriliruptorales bacterium]|nr:CPBP family intramembrane glutamic endopeptidase [Nitriliruptorales bacterium]
MRSLAGLSAALLAHSAVVNLAPLPRRWYVPVNLTTAGGLVARARWWDLRPTDVTGPVERLDDGLRWGLAASAVVASGLVATAAVARRSPRLRRLLADRRAAGMDRRRLAAETLVRIPLGTVLLEEVAFRGVLLAGVQQVTSTATAVHVASGVFGLWHVAPTVAALRTNGIEGAARLTVGVTAAVAATTLGGMVLCRLRLRSGSLVAPVCVHWALNAGALSVAVATMRAPAASCTPADRRRVRAHGR